MSLKKENDDFSCYEEQEGAQLGGSPVLGSGYICNAKLIGKQSNQSEWLKGIAAFDPEDAQFI